MRASRVAAAVAGLVLALPVVACGADEEPDVRPGEPVERPSTTTSEPSGTPTSAPTGTPTEEPTEQPTEDPADDLPEVTSPISLPALMREDFRAGRIRQGAVIEQTPAYTRSAVTYPSGDLTVSGILLRPTGRGPFPGIVLNHGYIEPSVYTSGQGLAREQVALAQAGYVVLHTDYRGHAGSDPARPVDRESRLGYTRDAINAVLALEREPYVDPDRMAMLGRSMGGGVTLNALVAYPDLVEAAVVYASVSSRFVDNLRQFTEPGRPEVLQSLYDRFGTPREEPAFYRGLSSRTYFDRVSDPLLIHHGTDDETCPFPWATDTQRLLERAGADSSLAVYEGEMHAFIPQFEDSIQRTLRFLDRRLGR